MTLDEYFKELKIELMAALPAEACPVIRQREREAFPDGASVIIAAIPFCPEKTALSALHGDTGNKPPNEGRLAAFATVPDYHRCAKQVLEGAAGILKERYGDIYNVSYVDNSPFDERRLAAMAGLGVIGRHGMLITEKYSSFVILCELVCSLDRNKIEDEGICYTDGGEVLYCEGCSLCAAKCPGGCIGSGRNTCVSFLNQKKGNLTEDEMQLIKSSGWLWGCDECAVVCPHTVKSAAAGTLVTPVEFFKKDILTSSDRSVFECMSEDDYKKYAFSWRKRDVMLRNCDIFKE